MNESITLEALKAFDCAFDEKHEHRVAMNATVRNGINGSAHDYEAVRESRHQFSNTIYAGKIKAGDVVVFSKYSGSEVKVDDKEYLIVRESDILAVL